MVKKKKKKDWVEYKEIKDKISMAMVLERYQVLSKLKASGKNLAGVCPIHKGSNERQFSVNLDRNLWNCFGNCQAGGNVLDFVAMMEHGEKNPQNIRKAALLLKNWFLPGTGKASPASSKKNPPKTAKTDKKKGNKLVRKETDPKERINKPLKFTLQCLEKKHAFFQERGIEPATVEYFGLGYCTKGMHKNRIAIPIHDQAGELVAYCGRAVAPEQIEKKKYKQPGEFYKHEVVYNLWRQKPDIPFLILVESFISVWWLHQNGYPNTVALMGASLGETQKRLITEFLGPRGRVLTMFDPDESGVKCSKQCLGQLGKKLFIKAIDLSPFEKKPHQIGRGELERLIEGQI